MATPNDASDSEPIDVEFSPADGPEVKTVVKSGGPGWVGLISAGVLAALAGGAIGVVASGTEGRYAQAAEVAVDISKLEEFDRDLTNRLNQMRDALRESEAKMTALRQRVDTGETASSETLAQIESDIGGLKARYVALLGGDAAIPIPDGAEGSAEATVEAPVTEGAETDLPEPTISLAGLLDRLNAMEEINPTGKAASPELARSVAALQERTSELEKVDAEFADVIEARGQILNGLEEQISKLEAGLGTVSEGLAGTNEQLKSGQETDQQAVAQLSSDLDALRTVLTEKLENMESVALNKDEQELVRRADRVLALSALETALRSEDRFASELEQLSLLLPANAQVSALRRLADQGIPSLETLRSDLVDLSDEVSKIGIPEKPSGKWAWVGDLLSGIVTIEEAGTTEGKAASDRIAAAIARLDAGNLSGAIDEIKPVSGPQGDALKPWLTGAERRLRADTLMDRLRSDVMDGDLPQ